MKMEEKLNMNTCCILSNAHLANMVCDILDVEKTGILPDGDHVNESTRQWLEDLVDRFYELRNKNESDMNVKNKAIDLNKIRRLGSKLDWYKNFGDVTPKKRGRKKYAVTWETLCRHCASAMMTCSHTEKTCPIVRRLKEVG